MQFVDTHCHVHFEDYKLEPDEVIASAAEAGVTKLICVGCTLEDSVGGVNFAASRQNIWATIGLHPHEAKQYVRNSEALAQFAALAAEPKVVGIGECGLDYYYDHSPRADQIAVLEFQLELAQKHDLPLILHVRDAFDDFWPVFDNFHGLRGVMHSFTDKVQNLERGLSRGLYVGVNGIVTFCKDTAQMDAYKAIPLGRLLLETDAPYLTPAPYRGTICQPKHVVQTAEFLGTLRGESLEQLAASTTANAHNLFKLDL